MGRHQVRLLLFAVALLQVCSTHKILYATSISSTSLMIPISSLAEGLVERGHDVTFIVPKEFSIIPKEVKQLVVSKPINFVGRFVGSLSKFSPLQMFFKLKELMIENCEAISNDQRIKEHLKSVKYDAVIVSTAFQQCLLVTILKYQKNVPFILYHPGVVLREMNLRSNGIDIWDVAFIPNMMIDATEDMNFQERFKNFFLRSIASLTLSYAFRPLNEILTKNLGPDHEDADHVEKKASFLFVGTSFEFDYPTATATETIMTGCLQCRPARALPKKFKAIADGSGKHGMIVFSLGSVVSNDVFSDEKLEAFTEAFRKVPQTVIWHSNRKMKNLPPNVVIQEWLPMQDLLGHPNLKVIISHGGYMTLQETFYHGVPYLGLPVAGTKSDRAKNTRMAMYRGIGLRLDLDNLTQEDILEKLNRLVNETSFKENARKISGYMKDQIVTSKQKAIFYTEYIIRHHGAEHFKSHGRNLSFVQLNSLDVIGAIILILAVVLLIVYTVLRLVYRALKGAVRRLFRPKKIKRR